MTKEEEIANFRRNVLPEYEQYLKELAEQKKANEKLGTVVKQCRICGKFKKLSAFYKNPLKKFGRFDECKECIKERRQNAHHTRKRSSKASVPA